MEARELFIGAWIKINGEPQQVDHICSYDDSTTVKEEFVVVYKDGSWETDEEDVIEPIPLTPEILEKAGFEVIQPNKIFEASYKLNRVELYKVGGDHSMYQVYMVGRFIQSYPQYLHQLQNLYFALTGTELEINL